MTGGAVLQQFWDEHRVSAHLLEVFVRLLEAPRGQLPPELGVLRDIVARECRYGDGVHHAREELLFER